MEPKTTHEFVKCCKGCGKNQPVSMFYRHSETRDRLQIKCKECFAQWQRENRIRVNLKNRRWQKNNRRQVGAYRKTFAARIREEFLAAYGGRCTCCGEWRKPFLTLEHIFHDGAEHLKRLRTKAPVSMLIDLKRQGWPKDRYTILCWNCNCATRYGAVCPHKDARYDLLNLAG